MKKFLGIIVLGLCLVCNNSFADETQKSMNDYLNEGWILDEKVEVNDIHRLYTLRAAGDGGSWVIVLCHVVVGEKDGSTFCYEP
jgi:hypothetical protein